MLSSKSPSQNPWVSIWTRPRQTIRAIVESNPRSQLWVLLVLGGIATALNRAIYKPVGDTLPLAPILTAILIMGLVAGIIRVYAFPWLLRMIGTYLGGKATLPELRATAAWSMVPLIWGLLLWIPGLALYGREWFMSMHPTMAQNPLPALFLLLVTVVLTVWSVVISVITIAEVQKFSVWKAILNAILAGIILMIIVSICSRIFWFGLQML